MSEVPELSIAQDERREERASAARIVFKISGARYSYDGVPALDSIDLVVNAGERVALMGANGCGKSTLLKLMDGLYFCHSGAVHAFDEELTEDRFGDDGFAIKFRRRIGFVFQNPDVQLFNPTVFDELAFGPLQLGWDKGEIKRQVADTLDRMEIAHLKDRAPHRLSGGEKKRVALASVAILDPEVLLLDEPTDALDPRSQGQVIDSLVGWGGGRKTVITATHNLEIIEDIADRCVILHEGHVVADGAPCDILLDQELLRRARLVHAHRHVHEGGIVHSHPHVHGTHEH